MSVESSPDLAPFLSWFQSHNGFLDASAMGLTVFPGAGRGAVALKDIPEGETLFTIPRALTLSTRTSALPAAVGAAAWKAAGLDKGWAGLILCMMWEEARGAESPWCEYLASLPRSFDTPMFWDDADLAELQGTSVVEKLGRDDVERDYRTKVIPLIKERADLFPPSAGAEGYSAAQYHVMGSRILSRSFMVERWEGEEGEENTEENAAADTSAGSGMDVDAPAAAPEESHVDEDAGEQSDDEEDEEDSSDIAMVPMADLLNAQYGSENAKLFHEEHVLRMVTTKPIKAGGQIWNTYGDLPNAELLRRYGHVDLVRLPDGNQGNPGDVVEIRADLVVDIISQRAPDASVQSYKERIDWWLEEGGDDIFIVEFDNELPEAMVSLTKLLLLPTAEWEKARDKGKPPKPKPDPQVVSIAVDVLNKRMEEYPSTIELDKALLSEPLSLNKKHAVIVRLAEKQILQSLVQKLTRLLEAERAQGKSTKRQRDEGRGKERGQKKAKR